MKLSRRLTPAAAAGTETEARPDFAYRLLIFYLFLLFFRPFDYVKALKVLHLPMVAGSLCLVVYIATRYSRGQTVFPRTPITKVLMAMSLWVLITVPFAFWIRGSLTAFWNDWMKMVILFFLLANVLQSVRMVITALWVCILGAAGVSLIAIGLKVFLGESVSEGRLVSEASGLYSGPNFLSMTLILLLPYVIYFFFLHRRLLVRLFAGFTIVTFTTVNMMTESRAGVIGETFVVLLAFWKLREWGVSLSKTLGVVILGGLLMLPLAPKGLWQRFSTLLGGNAAELADPFSVAHSAEGSTRQRKELLVRAIILTVENPIFGVGMNNFPSASHARFNSGPEDWLGCHDTFLQFSSELGIPGLLFYVLLLWTTWKTIRSARRRVSGEKSEQADDKQLRLLLDATLISFSGFVLFSVVAHLGYQAYFFVVAGFGQSLAYLSKRAPAAPEATPAPVREARASWIARPNPAGIGGY